jgi:polysaccharide export outer membrane protein
MRIKRNGLGISRATLILTLWSGLAVWQGCSASQGPPVNYAAEPDPRKHGFVLGPSDVLKISVWHNPDLSSDAIVRPDGNITLPLLGELAVAGLTTTELQATITERLRTFVKDEGAIVTVAVTSINSYRFTVTGSVGHPGVFSSTHYVTFSEAMTMAGGPDRFASPEKIIIQRLGAKGQPARRIPVNYTKVLAGESPEQDLILLAGDTIYVP